MTRNRRRGGAMVEFAMSASLLLPLMTGMFELGHGLYTYNKLQTAVRAGARHASMRSYNSANSTPSVAFETAVRNVVLYGNPAGGSGPNIPDLTPQHIGLSVRMEGSAPVEMTVTVNGYPLDTIFGVLTLTNKPYASFTYGGRYTAGF